MPHLAGYRRTVEGTGRHRQGQLLTQRTGIGRPVPGLARPHGLRPPRPLVRLPRTLRVGPSLCCPVRDALRCQSGPLGRGSSPHRAKHAHWSHSGPPARRFGRNRSGSWPWRWRWRLHGLCGRAIPRGNRWLKDRNPTAVPFVGTVVGTGLIRPCSHPGASPPLPAGC